MMRLYTYRIRRENLVTGERSKDTRTITLADYEDQPKVGGLWLGLSRIGRKEDHPGYYRVEELVKIDEVED